MCSSDLEDKCQKFLESLNKCLELSQAILSDAENNDEIDYFDKFFDGLFLVQSNLFRIRESFSNLSFQMSPDYSEFGGRIIDLKAYSLEKFFRDNDDIYVDLNNSLKDFFNEDD